MYFDDNFEHVHLIAGGVRGLKQGASAAAAAASSARNVRLHHDEKLIYKGGGTPLGVYHAWGIRAF